MTHWNLGDEENTLYTWVYGGKSCQTNISLLAVLQKKCSSWKQTKKYKQKEVAFNLESEEPHEAILVYLIWYQNNFVL